MITNENHNISTYEKIIEIQVTKFGETKAKTSKNETGISFNG
ncbi:hypothetical protein L323_17905 [Ruminiclostridium papyrosolvens C7]|uniref:Uncharacterized protein n=1 Tax=Ruminiclostridium papyrosolvens C7 TaxID=1330534 RepID=U4QX82_9FIRM|nr:hypothetical protein L323_17905 [Ruminiclostridium papyrosolvens C7]